MRRVDAESLARKPQAIGVIFLLLIVPSLHCIGFCIGAGEVWWETGIKGKSEDDKCWHRVIFMTPQMHIGRFSRSSRFAPWPSNPISEAAGN
jgi:sulfite exporter TauE/SafE